MDAVPHTQKSLTNLRRQEMPKVIVTAQVEDPAKWEEGFRNRRELFSRLRKN